MSTTTTASIRRRHVPGSSKIGAGNRQDENLSAVRIGYMGEFLPASRIGTESKHGGCLLLTMPVRPEMSSSSATPLVIDSSSR